MKRGVETKRITRISPGQIYTGHYVEQIQWERVYGSNEWVIFYIHNGGMTFRSRDRETYSAGPGGVVIYKSNAYQWYQSAGQNVVDYYWTMFHPRQNWHRLLNWPEWCEGMSPLSLAEGLPRDHMFSAMQEVIQLGRSTYRIRHDMASNALEAVLLWLVETCGESPSQTMDATMYEAAQYIRKHFSHNLTLEQIANATHQSVSRLTHRFKDYFGVSTQRYIEQCRMTRAGELLRMEPDMPLSEIADAVGYANAFYFSNRFKQWAGISPSAYRTQSVDMPGTGPPAWIDKHHPASVHIEETP